MFNFFKKKADVVDHWIAFADGFQVPPSEFYNAVEKEIEARAIPSLEMSRIDIAEGGVLSGKRVYLRMLRERQVFDVCAAPFGRGSFFSCRESEIPVVVELSQVIALALIICFFGAILVKLLSFVWGVIALLGLILASIGIMRNAVSMELQDLDKSLMQSPLVGPIYILYFRKETYHRIDTRLCYLHVVQEIVRSLAAQMTAEKGVKLEQQFQLSPMLGELYKRVPPERANAEATA